MESERLKFEKAGLLSVPRLPGQQVRLSLVIFSEWHLDQRTESQRVYLHNAGLLLKSYNIIISQLRGNCHSNAISTLSI